MFSGSVHELRSLFGRLFFELVLLNNFLPLLKTTSVELYQGKDVHCLETLVDASEQHHALLFALPKIVTGGMTVSRKRVLSCHKWETKVQVLHPQTNHIV